MDEMKDGPSSWAHEMKTYEMEKRRVLDEGFLRPPGMKMTAGQMKSQERVFDPLLQRYRDNGTEYKQRVMEETERIGHLNRARDIQAIREQPHHILHHESKFDAIAPGQDPTRQPDRLRKNPGVSGVPDSQQDFNIISNLNHDVHHWNRPEERPRAAEREGKQRKIHANRIRDFNIVSNRYPIDHEVRLSTEKRMATLEGCHKYLQSNKFDPVTQQFNDPKEAENAKHADDAREVEVALRSDNQIPPSYKGRHTQFYDAISNEVHDPGMVRHLETMASERKDRYRNRYIVEHNFHAQDIKGDHLKEARRLNKCAPERFMEHDRGYDVVTNKRFGNGAKEQVHYADGYPKPRKTPWEEIEHGHAINGRSASTPSLPSMAAAEQRSVQAVSSSAPARVSSGAVGASNSGAASQRSAATQRSQTLSEAGAAQLREPPGATRAVPSGRALSASGSVTSAAQFQEPPGATRPILRAASTPNLAPSPSPLAPAMARTPSEYSGAAARTRKLSPRMAPSPAPLGGSLTMKMSLPPPAPRIPGSPVGSVYSRPSAKA